MAGLSLWQKRHVMEKASILEKHIKSPLTGRPDIAAIGLHFIPAREAKLPLFGVIPIGASIFDDRLARELSGRSSL